MLEHARRKFHVGDRVREKHTGKVGIVACRPGEGNGIPCHLYGIRHDDGVIRAVHPLLLLRVEAVDDGCS
jgi:hypothetical protein